MFSSVSTTADARPVPNEPGMLEPSGRSLRTKVVAVVLLTTFVALVVSTVALLAYDAENYQTFLIDDARAQAEILARVNAPALAFNDPAAARSNLATLAFRSNFIAAAIYDADGELFATYSRDEAPVELPTSAQEPALRTFDDRLELFSPIVESGNILGTVFLRASYRLGDRIRDYSLILATVMLLSLVVALALSLLLVGNITSPVLAVAAVAQRVIDKRDFTLRARRTTNDEIGVLVDAFNAMLSEVDDHATALRASNRRLRKETKERRLAESALLAADRRKDEFLATLAHELRNPLAPMVNAIELLNDTAATKPQAARQAREIVSRQLAHLVRLIEDLLDVSRITSGKLTIRRKTVELAAIISDVEEIVQPLLDARGVRLSIRNEERPVYVSADPVRLAQVLSNLLNNAIKYSPKGGSISVRVEIHRDVARIAVTDTGIGIAAKALPRIFDMFSQGDSEVEGYQSGLGVGLTLAKYLIELHEGSITAESPGPGKGSTFAIELPILKGQGLEQEERSTASGAEPKTRHKILLVDDNVDFTSSLGLLLRMQGHTVQVANDGRSALKLASEFQPEFGFLDIGLPDISGYSLAKRLHELPETAAIVLVAISGWGQQKDRFKSADAGFSLHLVKPVGLQEIESAIDRLTQDVDS
jgi:signal transduction histidine kinase/ActR/RegA family two-component response regulator